MIRAANEGVLNLSPALSLIGNLRIISHWFSGIPLLGWVIRGAINSPIVVRLRRVVGSDIGDGSDIGARFDVGTWLLNGLLGVKSELL